MKKKKKKRKEKKQNKKYKKEVKAKAATNNFGSVNSSIHKKYGVRGHQLKLKFSNYSYI